MFVLWISDTVKRLPWTKHVATCWSLNPATEMKAVLESPWEPWTVPTWSEADLGQGGKAPGTPGHSLPDLRWTLGRVGKPLGPLDTPCLIWGGPSAGWESPWDPWTLPAWSEVDPRQGRKAPGTPGHSLPDLRGTLGPALYIMYILQILSAIYDHKVTVNNFKKHRW